MHCHQHWWGLWAQGGRGPQGYGKVADLGSGWLTRASGGCHLLLLLKFSGLCCSEFGATKSLLCAHGDFSDPRSPSLLPGDRGSFQEQDENRILETSEVQDLKGRGRESPLVSPVHLNEVGHPSTWPRS